MPANDHQPGGDHYKKKAIQPWDFIIANDIGFLAGNVIKYVARYEDKGGILDLEKARHYLDKLIEVEKAKFAPTERQDEKIEETPVLNSRFGRGIITVPTNLEEKS